MSTSVIVCAKDEQRTIPGVLRELRRIRQLDEIVVVVNGSRDETAGIARNTGARVISFTDALGHDIGRAIGARSADSDALLFLDADLVVPAEDLVPFIAAVHSGVDVALNRLEPFCTNSALLHSVMVGKRLLNLALDRPDLGINTLTAVPHALSRRGLEVIGIPNLAVPPLAHVKAVLGGLSVQAIHSVDVIFSNRRRPGVNIGPGSETVERLILGDHLEALAYLISVKGPRAGFTDLARRRELTYAGNDPDSRGIAADL